MHNDEHIWSCIGNKGPCAFKVTLSHPPRNFCKNKDNVTGLCCRSACPLANSSYATVIEKEGELFLKIKTVERAHMPNRLWEQIPLSKNFAEALQQVDTEMHLMNPTQINRVKARLVKLRQMLIRSRRLELSMRPTLVGIKKKTERREKAREMKAEAAANVEKAIEKELLDRLKTGVYGEIYNTNEQAFSNALENVEEEDEEMQFVEGSDAEEEENEDEFEKMLEEMSDLDSDEESDEEDVGSWRKKPKVQIEYEMETEPAMA
eukprot:gene191-92_t